MKPAPGPAPAKESEDDTDGLFGPFRIGPVVGVGVPNLLNYGVTAKLTRFLGFGVNAGMIPKVKISLYGDATLSYQEIDTYGRLYPFGGAFFLGAGVGYATMKGTFTDTVDVPALPEYMIPAQRATISSEAEVKEMILTPQLGLSTRTAPASASGSTSGRRCPSRRARSSTRRGSPTVSPRRTRTPRARRCARRSRPSASRWCRRSTSASASCCYPGPL